MKRSYIAENNELASLPFKMTDLEPFGKLNADGKLGL